MTCCAFRFHMTAIEWTFYAGFWLKKNSLWLKTFLHQVLVESCEMDDPDAPFELAPNEAVYYRCVRHEGVSGGGGFVSMGREEIVREVMRTSPEYFAHRANGWMYVFRMLTAESGWCMRDDVISVVGIPEGIGGVTASRAYFNPPRWHLTFAQNRHSLMVELVLQREKSWQDYEAWGELTFYRTPTRSRPHISLASRNDLWNSALIELFVRKVQAAHLAVTHGQHLEFELEEHNDMHWHTTTVPVIVAPMGIAISSASDPHPDGRRAAFFNSRSELIRQIRNLLFILGVAASAQGDVVDLRVTLPPVKFKPLGDLYIKCDHQPPPPPGPPPGFV